jgi:hypothetical protein
MNQTGRYEEEFRYISLCGKERNFVRSHDTPVVFTHARKVTEYFDNIEFTPVKFGNMFGTPVVLLFTHARKVAE